MVSNTCSFEDRSTYVILDAVSAPSQRVIFEIEYLESGMEAFDELAYLQWPIVIPESH